MSEGYYFDSEKAFRSVTEPRIPDQLKPRIPDPPKFDHRPVQAAMTCVGFDMTAQTNLLYYAHDLEEQRALCQKG